MTVNNILHGLSALVPLRRENVFSASIHPRVKRQGILEVANKEELYIFLHIPKCAGTTFIKHIKKNFPEDEAIGLDPDKLGLKKDRFLHADYINGVKKYFDKFTNKQKDKIRIIYGHTVPYGVHRLFERPHRYMTFVREPLSRVLSIYNYNATLYNNADSNGKKEDFYKHVLLINGKVPSFEEWVKKKWEKLRFYKTVAPFMPRFLQDLGFLDKGSLDQKKILAGIEKFYFVGLTNHYEDDSAFLYHKLKINKFFLSSNISKNYITHEQFLKVKSFISEKTKDGRKLYNSAVKFNEKFKEKHKEYESIVKEVNRKRKILLPFTQTIYDFPYLIHFSSRALRERSKIYSIGIGFIKGRS